MQTPPYTSTYIDTHYHIDAYKLARPISEMTKVPDCGLEVSALTFTFRQIPKRKV